LADLPAFSGLQPSGLQQGGKAPVWQVEKTLPGISANFRFFPL